ncbi:hypothetical protein JK635_07330 [Neobacillus sp. YIM B02564]|uniref:Uncharacterized protein n=1 Tax=Neobacillus paridis TaxID=2803862 RepID=A0ABS1TQ47_9BACI|nr:hypothetical protein [Neobacillus paridis]MBL4952020.1 hypothetical protein [Neobacillus paridis]
MHSFHLQNSQGQTLQLEVDFCSLMEQILSTFLKNLGEDQLIHINKDYQKMFRILNEEEAFWVQYINEFPKKKNGTFRRNRKKTIYRCRTLEYEDEESYGSVAPELRMEITNDLLAKVTWKERVIERM